MVDAGEHQGRAPVRHDAVQGHHDAVGGRTVHGEALGLELPDPERAPDRQRVAGRALLAFGRHHPDVAAEPPGDALQDLETRRVDASVVGDQDARRGEIDGPVRHRPR